MDFLDNLFNGQFAGQGAFLIIGAVGLVLLVLSVLLDGVFDVFELGDGPLSLTTISGFISAFGFVGLIATSMGASVGVASLAGAVVGFMGGLGAWALAKSFKKADSTTGVSVSTLEGRTATIILPIKDGSLGEIMFHSNGLNQTFSAKSKDNLEIGDKVLITGVLSNSSVFVQKYEKKETN